MTYEITVGERAYAVRIEGGDITMDGRPLAADARFLDPDRLSLLVAGCSYTLSFERDPAAPETVRVLRRGRALPVQVLDPRRQPRPPLAAPGGRLRLIAPMAGRVIRWLVAAGDEVEHGQGLLVLEAMKMQNEVRAPKAGRLLALGAAAGAAVAPGDLLAELE